MKRLKYLVFVVLCAFLSPLVIKAQCTDQRMAELNKIAGNVQISYNYDLDENGEPAFHIILSNITDDIYMVYPSMGGLDTEIISGTNEVIIDGYSGMERKFSIYSRDLNCLDQKIVDKYIKIPVYNSLSQESLCNKHPEFKYCKTWLNSSITLDDFNEEYEKTYNILTNNHENKNNEKQDNDFSIKLLIIVVVLSVMVLIVYLIFRRIKREK